MLNFQKLLVPCVALAALAMAVPALAITENVRSVVITNNRSDFFYFEELTAEVNGVDRASLALGATQSSSFAPQFGSSATGVIDDGIGACCGTGTHSANGTGQQIIVTFDHQVDLSQLTMHNRPEACCDVRMDDIKFQYFDGANGAGNLISEQDVVGGGTAARVGGFTFDTAAGVGELDSTPFKVTLQNATSDKAQTGFGGLTPDKVIDGITNAQNGWGNGPPGGDFGANVAVFETLDDIGSDGGSELEFMMDFSSFGDHGLGRFRISATTDDRSEFADGVFQGGDVDANWTELTPDSVIASSGASLTILGDNSILFDDPFGTNPGNDIYTITASSSLLGITGFRIEALADASLPVNGPGLSNGNGNFVLTEFMVSASELQAPIPEPTTAVLGLIGMAGLARRRRRCA